MARHPLPVAAAASAWSDALDVDDADLLHNPPSSLPVRVLRACTSSHSQLPHHQPTRRLASSVGDEMRLGSHPSTCTEPAACAGDQAVLLDPWRRALRFLGDNRARQRLEIRRIRSDQTLLRAPLVVATATASRPNGLGDLFLTLKDPTGSIGASVHNKVLSKGNIAEGISVDCVIILKEVAVFHSSRSACYLNITKANVVKVLQKSCCPLPMQVNSSSISESPSEKCTETRSVACRKESHDVNRDGTETSEGTAAISCQQDLKNINTMNPTVCQQRQAGSTPNYGLSNEAECSTENIMRRLLGSERMMPSNKEIVCEVASNSTSIMDTYDWCSLENHRKLAVDNLHQQTLNIANIRCAQSGLGGSSVLSGNVHSTQVSATGNVRQHVHSEWMILDNKRFKGDPILLYGNGETINSNISVSKMDAETKCSENNQNIEPDDIAEEFNGEGTSIRRSSEHQKKDFDAPNAGAVDPTQENCCTPAINATGMGGSLLSNPKNLVSVASIAEWTDEQLSELFADY